MSLSFESQISIHYFTNKSNKSFPNLFVGKYGCKTNADLNIDMKSQDQVEGLYCLTQHHQIEIMTTRNSLFLAYSFFVPWLIFIS